MSFTKRTHSCGELRAEHVGQSVVLNGWAHRVRDLGGLVFIDMRDRSGIVQLVLDPEAFHQNEVRNESCISVSGRIEMRDEDNRNPKMPTGDIDVVVESYEVLNAAKPLPFPVSDEDEMRKVNEELRVKYRYLDLRRPSMTYRLALRAAAISKIRRYLDARDFLDVETPVITKSTPEGARDYLVPYRLEPGKFYALPQSPQQYKQLLMVAGVERYYQIAKCFRDEAQRADRQPEFTQLDLEMSFVTQEDILQLMEGMTTSVLNELIDEFGLEKDHIGEFARISYDESMRLYGNDKPDLRFGLQLFDVTSVVADSGFGVFRSCVEGGGSVRGVRYPGGGRLSRKEIGKLEEFCKEYGAKGMASIAVDMPGEETEASHKTASGMSVRSSILKFFKPEEIDAILAESKAEPGDLLCFVASSWDVTCETLSRLRNLIGDSCGLRDPRKLAFAWVLDFPLVTWNPTDNRWDPSHHPFTAPKVDEIHLLETAPGKVHADCYDIVCNGTEWASGSIRIHQPEVQQRIFKLIGISEKDQQERFGHMIEAFQFGAPPHGGIAPGIDRLIMFLTDEQNIREVIAFPKMGNGYDPMMDAPSTIDPQQWAELGIRRCE